MPYKIRHYYYQCLRFIDQRKLFGIMRANPNVPNTVSYTNAVALGARRRQHVAKRIKRTMALLGERINFVGEL